MEKKDDKKEEKPNPNKELKYSITNEEALNLIHIIETHFNTEETLNKIRPELKKSYLLRLEKYPELKSRNDILIKLPVDKMNEEERLLLSFLSPPNLINDLSSILSYISNITERLDNPSDTKILDSILEIAISNFYASKIKLYSADANDSDTEEEKLRDQKMAEEHVPLSEEEVKKEIEELSSHPLFMTEMPKNPEDNVYLQAIQALKYEGKPGEVASEFLEKSKEKLEEYYKSKKINSLKEAMYHVCNAIDHVNSDESCDYLKFGLFYQRSKMQVLVKNYRYGIEDINSAIKFIPSVDKEKYKGNLKKDIDSAYTNLIDCHIELGEYVKARKIIKERVSQLSDNEKELKDKYKSKEKHIDYLKEKLLENMNKMEMFKNMKEEEKLVLFDELSNKGIKLKPQIHNVPHGYQSDIYKDANNIFHFPILIIYEEFNMTDYIQDFAEDQLMEDIFEVIFESENLPWDKENNYTKDNCLMYYQFSFFDPATKLENTFYYPMRRDETLNDVLVNKKVHMNGFPIISIISPKSEKFYQHFMKSKQFVKRKK